MSSRTERYLRALEQTTIGGQWQRGGRSGPVGQGVELARVQVPPSKSRGWVITLNAPPRGQYTGEIQEPPPFVDRQVESQHIDGAYVVIDWGNGGVSASVEVDWAQGGVVNVFGSEVRVMLWAPDPALQQAVNAGLLLQNLQAFISPGESRPVLPVTRTIDYGSIVADGRNLRPVPRFAKRFTIYQTQNERTWKAEFTTRSGGTVEMTTTYASSADNRYIGSRSAMVPRDATGLWLINSSVDTRTPRVQYELCL